MIPGLKLNIISEILWLLLIAIPWFITWPVTWTWLFKCSTHKPSFFLWRAMFRALSPPVAFQNPAAVALLVLVPVGYFLSLWLKKKWDWTTRLLRRRSRKSCWREFRAWN